ncbi:MAG: hypothetical protein WD225_11695 [Ilumatobacteraceae bacterium]
MSATATTARELPGPSGRAALAATLGIRRRSTDTIRELRHRHGDVTASGCRPSCPACRR